LIECETLFFSGCLDVDISIVEKSGDDPDDFRSNILDFGQFELGNVPVEKSSLFNVDDPLIRDNPGIEIIIEPENKEKIPDEKHGQTFTEKKKIAVFTFGKIVVNGGKEKIDENKGNYCRDDQQYSHEENKPMSSQKQYYIFIFMLAGEMKFFVHDILKSKIRRELIPVDRIEKDKIGNQQNYSACYVYKKHDHGDTAVDLIMEHMKNNCHAHGDIDDDQQGVKNGYYS
jgi:hypothetical protein